MTKPPRNRKPYPIRTCRYLCSCRVCGKDIAAGQRYYDGGYGRRTHVECAKSPEFQ